MKRIMSIATIALLIAGSSALACDTCGCKPKKAEGKKAACSEGKKATCSEGKKACSAKKEAKKCGADCTKPCCAPKADAAE